MKQFTIVGNWKMHFGPDEAVIYVKKLKTKLIDHPKVEVVIAPPAIDLAVINKDSVRGHLKLGGQNLSVKDEGAFTGEISGQMLREVADYVIVGHSERRRDQHETDKVVAAKAAAAVRNGLTPIVCVGEKLDDRKHNLSQRVVIDQVTAALHQLSPAELEGLLIAYEPVWAIGTGEFATPDQIAPIVSAIRHTVEELYGEAAGSTIGVLYGGSVDADNSKAYLQVDGVNGLLVGGASLNAEKFGAIVRAAQDEAIKK